MKPGRARRKSNDFSDVPRGRVRLAVEHELEDVDTQFKWKAKQGRLPLVALGTGVYGKSYIRRYKDSTYIASHLLSAVSISAMADVCGFDIRR